MNYDRWKHLIDPGNNMESMDWRHVRMIHAVLVGEEPASIVNIGVANGFSSTATLEASEASERISIIAFVDSNIRQSFQNALASSNPISATQYVEHMDSRNYSKAPQCWIIDGCHKEGAIADYENARKSDARIIIAHDTSEDWAPGPQWGAIEIGKRMRNDAVIYFEDRKDRKDELTKRGLVVAFFYQPKPETLARLNELAA